jgi:hypothetical protein
MMSQCSIQHIVVCGSVGDDGAARSGLFLGKVGCMPDSDSSRIARIEGQWADPLERDLTPDKDLVMEQILDNINSTPIGQVLKKIASLPEIRREKVLNLRREITEGRYDLAERLDLALDRVLEDLTA